MSEVTAAMVKQLRDKTGGGIALCKEALVACEGNFEEAEMYLRKKDKDKAAKKSQRATGQGVIFLKLSEDKNEGILLEIACETDFVAKNEQFKELGNELLDAFMVAAEFKELDSLQLASGVTVKSRLQEAIAVIGENIKLRHAVRIKAPAGGVIGSYLHFNQKAASMVALSLAGARADDAKIEQLLRDLCMHITSVRPIGMVKEDVPEDLLAKEREVFLEEVKDKPENIKEKILQGKLAKFFAGKCLVEQGFVKDEKVKIKTHIENTAKEAGGTAALQGFLRLELGLTPVVIGGEIFSLS